MFVLLLNCSLRFKEDLALDLRDSPSIGLRRLFVDIRTVKFHFVLSKVLAALRVELFFEVGSLFAHARVPVIFNGVVSPSFNIGSNICPRIFLFSVKHVEDPFFFLAPLILLDYWVQMIVPPFTALFADSTLELVGDVSPFLGTFGLDQHQDFFVFFLCPGAFDKTWVKHFLPTV